MVTRTDFPLVSRNRNLPTTRQQRERRLKSEFAFFQSLSRLCASQFQYRPSSSPPRPGQSPGHLTRVKLRTVGNLTQNEARPVGHLTFVSKRLSAAGNRRISQFFDSARAPRSRVIALVDSTWVFLLLSFLYRGICLCLKCGAKTS